MLETRSKTAFDPAEAEHIDRNLYCDSCLTALDETPNSGCVLADLHDPSHAGVIDVEEGKVLDRLDYYISVRTDETSNRLKVLYVV